MAKRLVLTCLLTASAIFAPVAAAQTLPASTEPAATQPTVDAELLKIHFPWLITHYAAKGYTVKFTLNDKEYASFNSGTGSATKMMPLQAGKNTIVIDITRTAPADSQDEVVGSVSLEAVPRQLPKESDALISLAEMEVTDGQGRITLTVDYVNTQPRTFTTLHQIWADAEHKQRTWEYTADGDLLASEYAHEKETTWRGDSKLAKEILHVAGKLMSSTAYKPDGSIGTQVKDGNGTDSNYADDGNPEYTVPIKDGQPNGEQTDFFEDGKPHEVYLWKNGEMTGAFKRYDEDGKLRVTGQMKDGDPDGVWQKLDDDGKPVAKCTYEEGTLKDGEDLYSPQPKKE